MERNKFVKMETISAEEHCNATLLHAHPLNNFLYRIMRSVYKRL